MKFYKEFSEKYDRLVSLENRMNRESEFFKEAFSEHDVNTVLDCACGTGQHVIIFKKIGFNAKGSDISSYMVEKARKNSRKYDIKAEFTVADFRNLTGNFDVSFDAVVCLGNSLPHLSGDDEVKEALEEMYKILNENGVLILEQRNFDMLLKKKKRFFPVAIRDDEVFFYVLDYFPEKIVFNVVNIQTDSEDFEVNTTEYNPLKKEKIIKLLKDVGFRNLKKYGDYQFEEFHVNESERLVIVSEK
ncbi:hypothetical protein AKJ63_01355 [candidate division MSBL1 archaeon SCGC-AAA259D18]|uniref:Methyltransferase domain-containing protein n=1 Tax=candidate division MSBL1 archaeon SCGC-AAA259D18 TaxID=1698262 RepID=A0A133UBG2_9EURY|nr:hypothetical protein AKJ63_01355 [candidate division MSBL1 archaeon SCGC-AAA259D18]